MFDCDPEWRGLKRAPDGSLVFYGWAVFGHILPRLHLAMFPCYADGETADAIGAAPEACGFERQGFVIEWFGRGLCIALGDVTPRVR